MKLNDTHGVSASDAPVPMGQAESRDVASAPVDLTKPHFRCICGVVAMPLTDETRCKCADIYDQEWTRVVPTAGVKEDQRG